MTLDSDPNMIAGVGHKCTTAYLGAGFQVVAVSGKDGDVIDRCKGLATRFTLLKREEEVARCHMSYRNGSFDPSMGPTIEMIADKQSHLSQGLLKVLWFWVHCFLEENFHIECLNEKTPPKHIMVKATYPTGAEIDKRTTRPGGRKLKSLSDKEFFYRFCVFFVRVQMGFMSMCMGGRRPSDEEAEKCIPLLLSTEERKRGQP